ncbi:MAG TPA: ribbon-helix-helix protein, CopG family [Thermomicrobiales bacterium]|nr:ribbon-helix-helix protein, CopG family [Thermomicrobiales bacterium]
MTSTHDKRNRVRLSLEVPQELNALLEELAAETDSTKSEVLRKAIALMDVAVDAKREGKRVFVSDQVPAGASREIVGI